MPRNERIGQGTVPVSRASGVSRRRLLGASTAGLGLGALGFAGAAIWRDPARAWHAATPVAGGANPVAGGATPVGQATPVVLATPISGSSLYVEPPVRVSRNGLLETTLEALPDISAGFGKMSYEGSIPGPTLRVQPGDRLRIRLINNLGGRDTNLHLHGMHVSPKDNSDNIFIPVADNELFDYEYAIPDDHPAGLYWYHPHGRGVAREQVGAGLAGVLIVEGGLDDLPGFRDWTERLVILQGPFMAHEGPEY